MKLLKLIYILFLSSLLTANLYSQEKKSTRIELVQANSFTFDKKLGNNVRRLIGSVIFKHLNYLLYCDSAYLYNEENKLSAFGHVRIKSGDTLDIFGDNLRYDGNTELAELTRNVKMVDKQMSLTTDFLTYNLRTDVANYHTGGTLIDPENTLKSQKGYYYTNTKKFFFKDNVILINPQYTMTSDTLMYKTVTETSYFYGPTNIVSKNNNIYCESGNYNTKTDISHFKKKVCIIDSNQTIYADSIYYDRNSGEGIASNNISIISKDKNSVIKGDRASYNEIYGTLLITLKAQLIMIDNKDSLYLHSDTLKALTLDSTKKQRNILAYHKVKFFRKDLQGLCDSLSYNTKDSIINMYRQPILWADKDQMSADFVSIKIKNNKINTINFQNSSFIISQFDTAKFNQVKGKDITAHFKNNELKKIYVKGNAETIYYLAEENGNLTGIDKSFSPDMLIYITDKKVHKVVHLEATEGTVYPQKEFNKEDAFLIDFKWQPQKRPNTRYDIFK